MTHRRACAGYNHATFDDLVLSGVVGLIPSANGSLVVNPLVPADALPWWAADGMVLHGRVVSVLFDADGKKYGKGAGLKVWLDGKVVAQAETMRKLTVQLKKPAEPAPTVAKSDDDSGKRIDWYIGHDWNWLTTNRTDAAYVAALAFTRRHRDLVDGVMPSFIHLNCSSSSNMLPRLNFSLYEPIQAAGIEVIPVLEGDASCCQAASCPLAAGREALAQDLLALALQYGLSGFTQCAPRTIVLSFRHEFSFH